jgi:DNA-binding NarL/FixJ family response regulator
MCAVFLLDVMLPERRGTEILRALRGDKKDLVPDSKIVVLTNFEQDDQSREMMERNVDAYLIKADITPKKLLAVIEQLN